MGDSDRLMEGHLHEIYEGVWEAVSMTVCWDCKCHALLFVNQIYSNYVFLLGEIE